MGRAEGNNISLPGNWVSAVVIELHNSLDCQGKLSQLGLGQTSGPATSPL